MEHYHDHASLEQGPELGPPKRDLSTLEVAS